MSGWYPRDGAETIRESVGLPFEERCAYSMLLDLMEGGRKAIPDDARWIAGVLGCSIRKWTAIRSRLIEVQKIAPLNGGLQRVSAGVVTREPKKHKRASAASCESVEQGRENPAETGAKPPRNVGENRARSNEINGLRAVDKNRQERTPPCPPKGGSAGEGVQVDLEGAIAEALPPHLDRRGEGFAEFWQAFAPPPDASSAKAEAAWRATAPMRPALPELLAAVAAYRKFIANESEKRKSPKPMCHPAKWLEERRWQGFAVSSAPRPPRDPSWNGKGVELASLIGGDAFASWFNGS
jgi:hypothetical protein